MKKQLRQNDDEDSDDEEIQESLKVMPKTVREYMIKGEK